MDTSRFAPLTQPTLSEAAEGSVDVADGTPSLASLNTRRAYASDWKHYSAWCRRRGSPALPPDPQLISAYITDCAAGRGDPGGRDKALATIERRLSSLTWNFAQRGLSLDRRDERIGTVIARLRKEIGANTAPGPVVMPDDLHAMLEALDRGTLRGLRDRAMLLLGFFGALRRSELVGLDTGPEQSRDATGWIVLQRQELLVMLRGRKGVRGIVVGRGPADASCPVHAVETWLSFARITNGPLFRRVNGEGRAVGPNRLNDREVARLVNRTARNAGLGDNFSSRALLSGRSPSRRPVKSST